ncbi:MAG: hypothetical protein D6686_06000 [Alphaproteobacteria bacterium]|nr:MAG: hypothetical protein D6686_06000 [Alphaproteobacteria bacterium]
MVGLAFVATDACHDLGWALLAASVPFGLAWFLHRFLADRPDSRAALAAWVVGYRLEDVDGAPRSTRRRIARYEAALAGVLDWLDARLSGPELERAGKESGTVAFSRGLPDHCLILALVYPFGALLLQWAAGYEGRLGALTVLPAAEPLTRAATIGALGLSGFLYVRHQRSGPGWRLLPLFILATGILGGWFWLFGRELGPIVFAAAGAVAVAVAAAVDRLDRRRGPRPAHMLALVLALLAGVSIAIPLLPIARSEGRALAMQTVLLFLALLSLTNALADFASIGVTRLFLRRGLHGRRIGFPLALADLAVAIAIFATLGCGLIAFVHLVRFRDGLALIDLSALFADLRANPGDYWWLAFMLLSTLLPTLIHLTIAVSSVFLGALRSGALAEMIACERQAFLCRAECGAFFLILTLAASAALAGAAVHALIWGVAAWLVSDAGPGPLGTVAGAILDGFEAFHLWLLGAAPR